MNNDERPNCRQAPAVTPAVSHVTVEYFGTQKSHLITT